MNIKELKELIRELPDDMEVILQKDAEGNGFSPLADLDSDCIYIPDSTWSGVVYSKGIPASEMYMEEEEWENLKKQPSVCVLCPVN